VTIESIQQLIAYLKELATPGVEAFIKMAAGQAAYGAIMNGIWSLFIAAILVYFWVLLWKTYKILPDKNDRDMDKPWFRWVLGTYVAVALIPLTIMLDKLSGIINYLVNPDFMVWNAAVEIIKNLR
jgi:undecaprenyl pyrophosphate phosphatase UppP